MQEQNFERKYKKIRAENAELQEKVRFVAIGSSWKIMLIR